MTLTAKDSGTLEYVFETDGKDVPADRDQRESGRDRRRFLLPAFTVSRSGALEAS